jgi:signal transduction histidine kinase
VQLVIADNAHGLPGEVKGHLFEPLIAATAASEPLHGLGAALACHLVRRHRGTIECRTEADRGTTVTITLPAAGE